MNWMVDGTFHALIVDKSSQTLSVWRISSGEPRMVESYRCATGENEGDKWIRGDMKTPEGVYFFCSVIDGGTLPSKYGLWAFTTDYPNFVDRRRGKGGDGIWLHGRDKPLGPKGDSNGCIALENPDLVKVSRFIRLQSTPLIVVKKMKMAPRSRIIEQELGLRDFIESWRQAWESRDLDRYMAHYSRNFQSGWLDSDNWKQKKRKLLQRYSKIQVRLGNVYLYRQNGLITTIFTQAYRSDGFRATGIKVLYITDHGRYRVYSEDYHRPVDDPYPAGALLAGVGNKGSAGASERPEFRIRLVSTDEPEQGGRNELESPRPVAPSRGVVLETLGTSAPTEAPCPALAANKKTADKALRERVVVARLTPGDVSVAERDISFHSKRSRVPRKHVSAGERARGPRADASGGLQPSDERTWPRVAALSRAGETLRAVEREPTRERGPSRSGARDANAKAGVSVTGFLRGWKQAWEEKDLGRFMKMYDPGFQAGEVEYKKLEQTKRAYFRKYKTIRIELEQVEIRKVDGRFLVKFRQTFRGDDYSDKGWKSMVLAGGKDKGFRILSEKWSAQ